MAYLFQSHSAPKFRKLAREENAITSLPSSHYHRDAESQHRISLYLNDCRTQKRRSHSLTPVHSTSIKKKKKTHESFFKAKLH